MWWASVAIAAGIIAVSACAFSIVILISWLSKKYHTTPKKRG